ncbi:hypothetical protein BDZ89DRAFT_1142102 [Hymenopellis radicata]|nr:hypothetical protein BDZ89DRAFT_1142102 [Hymenopellis radicata]
MPSAATTELHKDQDLLNPLKDGGNQELRVASAGADSVSMTALRVKTEADYKANASPPSKASGLCSDYIVATVNLDCRLDLKTIAPHARNAEYNSKLLLGLLCRMVKNIGILVTRRTAHNGRINVPVILIPFLSTARHLAIPLKDNPELLCNPRGLRDGLDFALLEIFTVELGHGGFLHCFIKNPSKSHHHGYYDYIKQIARVVSLHEVSAMEGFIAQRQEKGYILIGIDACLWIQRILHGQNMRHVHKGWNAEVKELLRRLAKLLNFAIVPLFVFDGPERLKTNGRSRTSKPSNESSLLGISSCTLLYLKRDCRAGEIAFDDKKASLLALQARLDSISKEQYMDGIQPTFNTIKACHFDVSWTWARQNCLLIYDIIHSCWSITARCIAILNRADPDLLEVLQYDISRCDPTKGENYRLAVENTREFINQPPVYKDVMFLAPRLCPPPPRYLHSCYCRIVFDVTIVADLSADDVLPTKCPHSSLHDRTSRI